MFVKDWIVSLAGNRCAFCGERIKVIPPYCRSCLKQILEFSKKTHMVNNLSDGKETLKVYSMFNYSDVLKKMILNNKRSSHPLFIEHFSEKILEKMPVNFFKDIALVPVPGSAFDDPHLVDQMTDAFRRKGIDCISLLIKKPFSFSKQKKRNEVERRSLDLSKHFRLISKKTCKEIILFDDVCTTGSTLLSLKKLIESNTDHKITKAVTIAFTKRQY